MQPGGKRKVIISFRLEHLLGWGVTIVLCVIPVILWAVLHPFEYAFNTFPAAMISVGKVTGLVGTVMYAINLLFSTRLRFLEYWFGGLNRVYIAHHLLGGLALVMLSIHPLVLALRYLNIDEIAKGTWTSFKLAALMLVPNGLAPTEALFNSSHVAHQAVLQQWAILFGIVAFWGMVVLLLVTFFVMIPYRLWLFTHKFLGVAFAISALHVLYINSDTATSAALKTYMLTIIGIGIASYIYKTLLGSIVIKRHEYKIVDVTQQGGGVTQLLMQPLKDAIGYKPGQFVFIRFRGTHGILSKEWHPFSISSNPADGALQISVKALGDYTGKIAHIEPGAIADIEGAYGRFSYTNYSNKDQIWIAGGIGVTPFLSMMKDLPDEGCRVELYYSVKTESELIDWPMLYNTAIKKPKSFRVVPFVGDKQPKFLDVDYIIEQSGDLNGKDFYLCGPPPMMQSIKKQLRAKGVPATSIHSEEFAMS